MPRSSSKTIVIGAGVIGVSIAYYLAKRGAEVTVLEKDEIGHGASFGNAGAIAPGHAPINKPGRVKQALKSVFDPVGPLYIKPHWNPDLIRWLWTFRSFCSESRLLSALKLLGDLGHPTSDLFAQMIDDESLDCEYKRNGYYEIYSTDTGLNAAKREAEITKQHGYHPEAISGDELREIEPAIGENVIGGVFFKDSGTIDPYRFVSGLAAGASTRGVQMRETCPVTEIVRTGRSVTGVRISSGEILEADNVVICAGAYTSQLTKKLGIPLPLQAAKGYHSDRDLGSGGTPNLGITFMLGERSVYCTPMGDFLRLAGTLEFSGLNHDIRRPRLDQLTRSAKQYVKGIEDVKARSEWCGLRPCLPDGYPAVGPIKGIDGLFVATGHAMLGLTLGPITGKLVSEMVLDGRSSIDINEFGVDRFG